MSELLRYKYSYSLMSVMGSDDKNYFIIIETDDPLKYYFREDSYEDIVELVEDRTGRIMATWHLFQDEFKSGAYKHRFYSINEM